jgi:hypothetical protein
MERNTEAVKPQWKKIGGGSFYLGKRIIKPGQIFFADADEIPVAFRDTIIPVDGTMTWAKHDEVKETPNYPVNKISYSIEANATVENKGKSKVWFDLVTKDGKVLNEKGLKKEEAEEQVRYNLVSSEGKVLNEKPLFKSEAEILLKALEA